MIDQIEQQIWSAELQELGEIEEEIEPAETIDMSGAEVDAYDER